MFWDPMSSYGGMSYMPSSSFGGWPSFGGGFYGSSFSPAMFGRGSAPMMDFSYYAQPQTLEAQAQPTTRQQRRQARRNATQAPATISYQPSEAAATPPAGAQMSPHGNSGWTNMGAGAGQPIAAIGGQGFNTQFGELVPASGGMNGVYKRAGQGENDLYNWGGNGWQQMSLGDYHANPNRQYTMPPSGAQSGQQMQTFYRLGEDPAHAAGVRARRGR